MLLVALVEVLLRLVVGVGVCDFQVRVLRFEVEVYPLVALEGELAWLALGADGGEVCLLAMPEQWVAEGAFGVGPSLSPTRIISLPVLGAMYRPAAKLEPV
ncbi:MULTISPECIES: hypothetical protein [unclassified Streptomyces]|uniref:hypothetical protein n=1 Tax=unclassified Streptomyces TaxID=2593676 RepID=UPI0006F9DE50|nr:MULTISPECIES: hypothetical protein [unclassified Streptomyces]KQX50035.1 hypothetical protein ASD33_15510 [Streptomyces sp. Root1304]KRA79921.1 hypothetical protein ASE09_17400 [Streptomyces sp. Root66D1]